jgi:hypothetical protein
MHAPGEASKCWGIIEGKRDPGYDLVPVEIDLKRAVEWPGCAYVLDYQQDVLYSKVFRSYQYLGYILILQSI